MTESRSADARSVVLDMDVGIDDALAIFYLAAQPNVEIVALGSVHGNCAVETSTLNALRVLEVCGLGHVPVAAGASEPLEQELALAPFVHGENGLGDVQFPRASAVPSGEHAADQLIRLAHERPGELDLIAVGPLTNLGLALLRDPELLTRYRSVSVMGGSGPFPPAGTLREVDANIAHDMRAAELVFNAPRQLLNMVGVNVCTPVVLEEHHISAIEAADTPQARFTAKILPFYLDFYRYHWGRRISPQYDALTAGIAIDPTFITASMSGPLNLINDGGVGRAWLMQREDGGVLDVPIYHAPDTLVATQVDGDRFIADLVSALSTPFPSRANSRTSNTITIDSPDE